MTQTKPSPWPRPRMSTLEQLSEEVCRARGKFPDNKHLLAALMEEVGELAKDLLENKEGFRIEAIQVACVALRIAEEGDGDFQQ